jgi:hypothetical protein
LHRSSSSTVWLGLPHVWPPPLLSHGVEALRAAEEGLHVAGVCMRSSSGLRWCPRAVEPLPTVEHRGARAVYPRADQALPAHMAMSHCSPTTSRSCRARPRAGEPPHTPRMRAGEASPSRGLRSPHHREALQPWRHGGGALGRPYDVHPRRCHLTSAAASMSDCATEEPAKEKGIRRTSGEERRRQG